ncbi:hypothetical protein EVAR_2932_1 [Eumeta japonica]|uniref:Uncharacterized protein n=1 Tax=Eumeta variegata TaxID=151549 RepID=A0A4C1T0X9_EUMVA|nr:hypothetical protein EVAR_2932_1 [Eumeta japonica]
MIPFELLETRNEVAWLIKADPTLRGQAKAALGMRESGRVSYKLSNKRHRRCSEPQRLSRCYKIHITDSVTGLLKTFSVYNEAFEQNSSTSRHNKIKTTRYRSSFSLSSNRRQKAVDGIEIDHRAVRVGAQAAQFHELEQFLKYLSSVKINHSKDIHDKRCQVYVNGTIYGSLNN